MAFGPIKYILVCITAILAAGSASACSSDRITSAHKTTVPTKGINAALFDSAVRYYVNRNRCAKGLRPVSAQRGLKKVASNHAKWMARSQTVSHQSKVRGERNLKARLKASGAKYRLGAENLGAIHRYQIEGGVRFITKDISSCLFTAGGRRIPSHTYDSLARWVVKQWMGSQVHRANILRKDFSAAGASIAFDPKAANCGKFYIAQNYIG